MDRNEGFPALQVASVSARLAWASLQMTVERIDEIQVLVDGQDADVEALRMVCSADRLLIEQPAHGVSITTLTGHWMQIRVRVPEDWKGAVDLNGGSGPVSVYGIAGSDLRVSTTTGDLTAVGLKAITCRLTTVSGGLNVSGVACEELDLRTVNGKAKVEGCDALRVHMNSVNSDWPVTLVTPFEKVDANTVTGSVQLEAPVLMARCVFHTVTGRLRTWGVSLQDAGAPVTMDSVSGDLSITCAHRDT